MAFRFLALLLLCLISMPLSGTVCSAPAQENPSPPPPSQEPPEEPETMPGSPEEELFVEPAPPALPEEYGLGRGYLGNFVDAWNMDSLQDPINARIFLALQDGAGREALEKLEIPDLDLALEDLTSGRMIRESGGIYRPGFPLVHGDTTKAFSAAVESAAAQAYASLKPALKKIKKAARKEKMVPWLYALAWSEMLESRSAEETLVDAGGLDPRRLRDEGYMWILIPAEPGFTADDRYSSGSETLHYLWSTTSYLNPVVQDYASRRRILDGGLAPLPWDDEATRETFQEMGILDAEKHVRVPVLRKGSRLLSALRASSQSYVKDFLRTFKPEPLARSLGASRDEIVAAAFSTTGCRVLDLAVRDGFVTRPEYLAKADASPSGLAETLVIAENETFDPLERAYYLYDRGNYSGAIEMADRFLQTHPGDSEALFRKGISQMKLRKYPEALKTFEEAAARPAAKGDVWRGWILIREGNILDVQQQRAEALKKYQEALKYADVSASHDSARNWLENIYQD
jgi:tetratricopeptide (TPR) repeat protein